MIQHYGCYLPHWITAHSLVSLFSANKFFFLSLQFMRILTRVYWTEVRLDRLYSSIKTGDCASVFCLSRFLLLIKP